MLTLIISDQAYEDIAQIHDWYWMREHLTARYFLEAVEAALHRIEAAPKSCAIVRDNVRKARMGRFPYAVYYVVDPNFITIAAVIHDRRHPDTWTAREEN